jgi:tellurite resistance protein TehA-like permease
VTRLTRRLAAPVPPAAGAAVMGTGVESIALRLVGHRLVSSVLLGLAVVLWAALAVSLALRAAHDRAALRAEARSPAALTGVAGTCVLGSGLAMVGCRAVAPVLLGLAALAWLLLQAPVWRHWTTPVDGAHFLVTVAAEAIAVLGAAVALADHARWLALVALALVVLGLALYVVVLARFDARELLTGRGDHWVAGGALAIAALASADLAIAAMRLGTLASLEGALRAGALALCLASLLWVPGLLAGELVRPRLVYDVRRWATVFPVGMYAAASSTVGRLDGSDLLASFARAWAWVGLALWCATAAATLRGVARALLSATHSP